MSADVGRIVCDNDLKSIIKSLYHELPQCMKWAINAYGSVITRGKPNTVYRCVMYKCKSKVYFYGNVFWHRPYDSCTRDESYIRHIMRVWNGSLWYRIKCSYCDNCLPFEICTNTVHVNGKQFPPVHNRSLDCTDQVYKLLSHAIEYGFSNVPIDQLVRTFRLTTTLMDIGLGRGTRESPISAFITNGSIRCLHCRIKLYRSALLASSLV